ncbi:hypothetical protein [Methylobacterium aquaticum]|uniref:hypothetical protein n=1 Tax=Methylobacterium aquaticum TaxID=270351 RepID=UPI001933BDBB|nr:hypothetical protein [Methylobacterium aquaticum]QRE74156.1 hypothetical protein F1D61_11515 [Methylobacterium aquaticum]
MIRSPWLERSEWEAKLRRNGCEPLPGKGRLNTAEWWHRPGKGPPFTVPVEEDGHSDFWAIQRICDGFRDVPRLPLDD